MAAFSASQSRPGPMLYKTCDWLKFKPIGYTQPLSYSHCRSKTSTQLGGYMTKLWQEFKAFALKGNMIDLAVAVVIGAAFSGVVNSMVKNLIMPIVSYVTPSKGGYEEWHLGKVAIGLFLSDVLNFLIVAVAV